MPIRARGVLLVLAASAPVGVADLCHAQSKVEFRVVERSGQSVVSPTDSVLNFAVQGRVSGESGIGLGGFAFSLIFNAEAPTSGMLARDAISTSEGEYWSGIGNAGAPPGSTVGIARQFGYLVGISSIFNGLINSSGGGWTQTPSQDIGLISGFSAGQYLLGAPGVDSDLSGDPDTAVGDVAKLPPSLMSEYFGADGNWIDLYRFRYTVTTFTPRMLDLHLVSTSSDPLPTAFTFTQLESVDGSWGMASTQVQVPLDDVEGLRISVIPAPATVLSLAAFAVSAAIGTRRRR